jgi:hypothetical protein
LSADNGTKKGAADDTLVENSEPEMSVKTNPAPSIDEATEGTDDGTSIVDLDLDITEIPDGPTSAFTVEVMPEVAGYDLTSADDPRTF